MPAYTLTESARTILEMLASEGPATRPTLGRRLQLSKPTVSTAIAELAVHRLVREDGVAYGRTGRSAIVYRLGPAAGHVLGIDIGRTRATVIARALDGAPLGEAVADVETGRDPVLELKVAHELATAVRERLDHDHGPLRAVAIGLPTTVSSAQVGNVPMETYRRQVASLLVPQDDVPVIVENNVNCAAIAELFHGVAVGRQTFAYLQVGVRVGVGLVIDRHLIRGSNGFAGEVSHIPFPWAPDSTPRPQALEWHLGSAALVRRCHERWRPEDGAAPKTAEELFTRAEAGSAAARDLIAGHGRDVGRLAAALVAVLDPGLIVLGGGVGQNPLLLPHVRQEVAFLEWETAIEASVLGSTATALGAARIATEVGLEAIVGQDRDWRVAFSPQFILAPGRKV